MDHAIELFFDKETEDFIVQCIEEHNAKEKEKKRDLAR